MIINNLMPGLIPNNLTTMANSYNALADWSFYDVGALTATEFEFLIQQKTLEGSILVVHPSGKRDMGVSKHSDFNNLSASKGKMLQRYTIAGVGSSDVGAAALARNFADHYQEPVGAIVAGYGVADLMGEALGGWFALGGSNRELAKDQSLDNESSRKDKAQAKETLEKSPDSSTLYKLLTDSKRQIKSIGGHSKGCLSIALALQVLTGENNNGLIKKAQSIEYLTLGTVVEFPDGFEKVLQFIGSIDWFGGINSRHRAERIIVNNAWHHLNTTMPMHLDVKKVLAENKV